MGINNNKFRFGTIAGIKPGFGFRERNIFPFPCFNHLKYFPGLPEAIEKLNNKIIRGNRLRKIPTRRDKIIRLIIAGTLAGRRVYDPPAAEIMELSRLEEFNLRSMDFCLWIIFFKFGRFTFSYFYASYTQLYNIFFYSLQISSVIKIKEMRKNV